MTLLSDIEDDFKDCVLDATEGIAETVAWLVYGGSSKNILAIVHRDPEDQEFDENQEFVEKRASVKISKDTTAGIAAPTTRDKVTFDGLAYAVESIDPGKGRWLARVKIQVRKKESTGKVTT